MNRFIHQRHKTPTPLERPRELVLVCAPMRSKVNLSRIVRAAGCSGVQRVIACGAAKIDRKIARDGADTVHLDLRRTMLPALQRLREDGFRLVGLEQTSQSSSLHDYQFRSRTALVIGNERSGLDDDTLAILDDVVEIPVYGMPFSYNVGTAAAMALYEYCRQFPRG